MSAFLLPEGFKLRETPGKTETERHSKKLIMGDTQKTERGLIMSEPNTNTNTNTQTQEPGTPPATTQQNNNGTPPTIDYDKLAGLIAGKQSVTEDTVLKSYFKQQGLSVEEMNSAITAYKDQKAKNTPDVAQLQSDLTTANSNLLKEKVKSEAQLEAIKQGVGIDAVQYVLKMADLKNVTTENGEIIPEKVSEAIKKVLETVPALKGTVQNSTDGNGITVIGGDSNGGDNKAGEAVLRGIFGVKSK